MTKIYSKLLISLLMLIFQAAAVIAQAPPVTTVGPATLTGGTYTVPVTVTGFNNVGSISLKLNFDPNALIYTGLTLNSGIPAGATVVTPTSDQSGTIGMSYISSLPIVLGAPANTLFTVTFTTKPGVQSGPTLLSWSTVQGACDMTPPSPGAFVPPIDQVNFTTYFIGGSINIARPIPTITGPVDPVTLLPATLSGGITTGQVYTTEAGMTGYAWNVSAAGTITAGANSNSITVTWTNPTGQQSISVDYFDANGVNAASPTVLIINYYPFAGPIDPTTIPQFVDPLPHFAAGLRVNAKAGGSLLVKTVPVQQVALSTGTVTSTGTIGDPLTPNAGKGNYAAYAISKDNGLTFGPAMWPAQTVETQQGFPLQVQYRNDLFGLTYDNFNILADQTLMMHGYTLNGDPKIEPYRGDIPMVVHLHGGEIPSGSDGGPNAWFTPGYAKLGPGFQYNASSLVSYPNQQEAATLWFHPHDDGLTRINVYTGLAAFYLLRGADEETAKLPGWSGDDLVQEVTPAGKQPTFNGTNAYLPEIEIGIQDRMFNTKGELYWPVAPPNPELHPFWTPEFVGDIMVVNGKTWPYLSVAPRKYRFRVLNGCNARFLNMWLVNAADGVTPGPKITVVGGDAGLLATPQDLDPALGQALLIGTGQRYDVVIDFTGVPAGTTFTLMNNAGAPYPFGSPVVAGTTDRIMQFVVNGNLISAAPPATPADKSLLPANLRPVTPMVQLTDFAGTLSAGVTPVVHRQIVLNEVSGAGGPAAVLINNTYYETLLAIAGAPYNAGGPSEFMTEGTTEKISIINISADAHPIHIHLLQWQLVSRQAIDDIGYMNAYMAAWAARGIPENPAGLGYPGGAGPPLPYGTLNTDGAVGGNPAVTPFLVGPVIPANREEQSWKDNTIVLPGQVTTFIVRVAPTDRPINAPPSQLLLPFDPSLGPGYVWHCHIIDHEDMSMMRPMMIQPSPLRYPQITTQPAPVVACAGDAITFSVSATSATPITYVWQFSVDGGTTWTDLTNTAPYSGVQTNLLGIAPAAVPLSTTLYRCVLTNIDGITRSNAALLTVNNCSVSGSLKYANALNQPLAGMTVSINGISANTDALGNFVIPGVTSGTFPVVINSNGKPVGAINSTDAGNANFWFANPVHIPNVKYISGDVNTDGAINAADGLRIQRNFVLGQSFSQAPWVFWGSAGSGNVNPPSYTVTISGTSLTGVNILGLCAGDFNGSYNVSGLKGAESGIQLLTGDLRTVTAGKEFDLTITSEMKMQVGAVSLILNLPANLVDVRKVSLAGSNAPVTFKVSGDELRIGWNSTNAVTVQPDGSLLNLTLKAKRAFSTGEQFGLTLVPDPLNEIADGDFRTVDNPLLKSDVIIAVEDAKEAGSALDLQIFPNPVTNAATLTYKTPFDGNVLIDVHNVIGESVMTLVNENKPAGTYSSGFDSGSLQRGIYFINLKLDGKDADLTTTIRVVIKK